MCFTDRQVEGRFTCHTAKPMAAHHLWMQSMLRMGCRVYDRVSISLHGTTAQTNFAAEEYSGEMQQQFAGMGREELQRALGVKPMDKSSRSASYLPLCPYPTMPEAMSYCSVVVHEASGKRAGVHVQDHHAERHCFVHSLQNTSNVVFRGLSVHHLYPLQPVLASPSLQVAEPTFSLRTRWKHATHPAGTEGVGGPPQARPYGLLALFMPHQISC